MRYLTFLIPLSLLIAAGCQVENKNPDESLPAWYPAFIYKSTPPDTNDANVNIPPADPHSDAGSGLRGTSAQVAGARFRPDKTEIASTFEDAAGFVGR